MAPAKNKPFAFKNKRWNKAFHDFVTQTNNFETQIFYYRTLRRFFLFVEAKYGEQRTPDTISAADIEDFLREPVQDHARRAGKSLSPYSYNSYLTAIKAFYAYCARPIFEFRGKTGLPMIKKGAIPSDDVKLAKCGDADRDMSEEEVRAFFRAIDRSTLQGKRDFALFWALFISGQRRAAIVRLRRGDIEPFIFEQGRKGWRFHFVAKWRTERESAEMSQSVIDAIIEFHKAAGRDFMTMPPETPIFPGIHGVVKQNKPMDVQWCTNLFRGYAKKAGISPNIVTHSLRHENAWQRYIESGYNILAVQEALGWRDIKTAMAYIARKKKRLAGDPIADKLAAKFT